ncbi:MAG: hypothetical protein ABIO70_33360 [Pseudomonadota bacterium]
MEGWVGWVSIAGFGVLLAAIVGWIALRGRHLSRAWRARAMEHGLRYHPGWFILWPSLRGRLGETEVRVEVVMAGSTPATRLPATAVTLSRGGLHTRTVEPGLITDPARFRVTLRRAFRSLETDEG